jgi:hypothetical protein
VNTSSLVRDGMNIPVIVLPYVNAALASRAPFRRAVQSLREEGVRVLLGPGGWNRTSRAAATTPPGSPGTSHSTKSNALPRWFCNPRPHGSAEVWALAVLQVVADPEPLRVVHGKAVEFTGVEEVEFGGLVAGGQSTVRRSQPPLRTVNACRSPAEPCSLAGAG